MRQSNGRSVARRPGPDRRALNGQRSSTPDALDTTGALDTTDALDTADVLDMPDTLDATDALDKTDARRVSIELTATQVQQVVRRTSGDRSFTTLISSLDDLRELIREDDHDAGGRDPRISHSLLRGLALLSALPSDGSYIPITKVAVLTGLAPSTAYRYINTWVTIGIVERHERTREYRLASPA